MKAIYATAILALLLVGAAAAQCVDSDNGSLSYTHGYVVDGNTTYQDYCLDNGNVIEFTCENNASVSEEMPCMKGCGVNWQGLSACKPTAGGSRIVGTTEGSVSSGSEFSSESDNIVIDEPIEAPEFSVVAASLALVGSTTGYLLLRKRN